MSRDYTDFVQPVRRAEVIKGSPDATITMAVRVYCAQHNETWNLQVFGKLDTPKAPNLIATAALDKEQLVALRRAIDLLIGEAA